MSFEFLGIVLGTQDEMITISKWVSRDGETQEGDKNCLLVFKSPTYESLVFHSRLLLLCRERLSFGLRILGQMC